jgi:hypothetical protein
VSGEEYFNANLVSAKASHTTEKSRKVQRHADVACQSPVKETQNKILDVQEY